MNAMKIKSIAKDMKNINKAIVVITVVFFLLVPFVSFNVEAKSEGINTVAYKSKKVSISIKNGTVTVRGKGKMPAVKQLRNNKKIKKVIIKNGITSIPDSAFSGCKNLTSVKFPKTLKSIGTKAFYKTSLKSLVIPNSVKSIGERAFCTGTLMTEIKLPGSISIKRETGFETESGFSPSVLTTFRAKRIVFTNDLKELGILLYFSNNATEFAVSKNDKLYSSENGIIYSKDFKRVVRIPNKKVIKIKEGCEVFDLYSLYYGEFLDDGGAFYPEDAYKLVNTKARKIILPKSLKTIVDSEPYRDYMSYSQPIETIVIQSVLDEESVVVLNNELENHKNGEKVVKIINK